MIHPQFHTKGELCSHGENTGNIYVKIILVVGPLSGVECSGVGVHKSSFLCSISIKRLKRREKRDRPSPPLEEKLCLPCALLLTHKSSSCAVHLYHVSHFVCLEVSFQRCKGNSKGRRRLRWNRESLLGFFPSLWLCPPPGPRPC